MEPSHPDRAVFRTVSWLKDKDMASTIPPPLSSKAPLTAAPFDLDIEIFARMVEAELIPRDRRVFLLEGRLFEKMTKTKAHGYVGAAVNWAVARRLPDGWSLWPESTIVLDSTNAPLPDFTVIRGSSPLDFATPERYPGPADVGLVIEISVSSLRSDLTTILELYARAAIPVYWVVDVAGRRVLVHEEPRVAEGRGEYARVEIFRSGDSLPLILDGRETARIPFEELLG